MEDLTYRRSSFIHSK